MNNDINEGYPGDLLSRRKQKYLEDIQKMQNRRTGYGCMKWGLAIFVIILVILCYLWSQGYFSHGGADGLHVLACQCLL